MTKTEQAIMDEIASKGYAVVEHGYNGSYAFGRKGPYGARRFNAMIKLRDAGKIQITGRGTDRDAHRGWSCIASWARVQAA